MIIDMLLSLTITLPLLIAYLRLKATGKLLTDYETAKKQNPQQLRELLVPFHLILLGTFLLLWLHRLLVI